MLRRLCDAKLGAFKPLADVDWHWPQQIDRELFTELLGGEFIHDATNIVLVGPHGVGKSMLAKNLVYQAVINGASACFVTASDLLHDLAAQDSSADLLFEVVTRRYQRRPIIVTTYRSFAQWNDIFPNAACVVSLVDRLVHCCEILPIEASSYRLKEAQERAEQHKAARPKRAKKTRDEPA